MLDLERAVLELVLAPNYRPVKPRYIAKQLGLPEDETRDLKRTIKKLVKRNQLAYGANHLVTPPASGGGNYRITGIFRRTEHGYGFVRPAGSAPGADRKQDIFITAKDAADASTGDTVLVRLKTKRNAQRPNPEGEIVEVIERQTNKFVGTYFETAGAAFVQIDGKSFSQPISVGDPGAKSAQPDDKVVVEMVRFPSLAYDGEAVVIEVLGARGTPGVDTLSVIREFGLPEEFAPDALDEARAQTARFDESIPPHRKDLTGTTIITIDPVDARDFDDAISLSRDEKGHWRLGVHIADVTHFVPEKTALDREAHARATSVYLPDRVIPMLPELISNGLASLQPDRVRYTKTCFIEFSPEGIPLHTEAASAAIRSARRFTYEEVDEYLADREAWQSKLTPPVHKLLADMHELAMLLRERRMKRGSLELTMPEVKIDLNKQGEVSGAHLCINTESHQVIEEFMLAANEAIAELLHRAGLHFLRRVHQAPDPRKLKALSDFVAGLGFSVESLENRFELQELLGQVAGQPEQHAVNYALLRSLQRAVYSPEENGHYALASECYCHFTSPIRRYPDLTVHRLLDAYLQGRKPRNDFGELAVLGEHCSDRERRAEAAERELTKVKLLNYLSTRIGLELDGVVTGVEEFGMFVQGSELPAEGLIHVASLQDDFYRYDRSSHSLTGNKAGNAFRLGDKVRVVVARVDVDRRVLDFRLVSHGGRDHRSHPTGFNAANSKRGLLTARKPTKRKTKSAGGGKKAPRGKKRGKG